MSLRKKLQSAVAGAGVALHTVLTPTTSRLEEPQSQSVPDRDYEGIKRGLGGAFQPADEQREDAWRVQSRSSPEANALFYGTDKKQYLKTNDLGSFDQLEGEGKTAATLLQEEQVARAGVAGVAAANDAEWERRKAQIDASGRLHREALASHPAARAQRAGVTEEQLQRTLGQSATPHTCHDAPTEICRACLEANQ